MRRLLSPPRMIVASRVGQRLRPAPQTGRSQRAGRGPSDQAIYAVPTAPPQRAGVLRQELARALLAKVLLPRRTDDLGSGVDATFDQGGNEDGQAILHGEAAGRFQDLVQPVEDSADISGGGVGRQNRRLRRTVVGDGGDDDVSSSRHDVPIHFH